MSYPIHILSSPCVPYVIGYSLNYAQMLQLAPRLCTPEELNLVPDHPEVALNQHLVSGKIQQAFLPYKEADGLVYYLWIKGVLPSFSGKKPTFIIPPVDLKVYPDLAGLGHVKRRCIIWPIYLALPTWFYPRLTTFTQMQLEKQKKKQQQQELEATNNA
ncbi:hypothetical protein B0H17DRAFT_1033474 [Mycena rosella]|uniref:Uncharacterized protein n=1 Tax=Mycena rosella TaxID=1033263 RepID=A0AAD7GY84_MYCRO|nr:hypothetical protein B0H17DRAFT_1033474 [Mycena rosella]